MRSGNVIHIQSSKRILARLLAVLAILCRTLRRLSCKRSGQKRVVVLEPFGLGDVVSHEPMVRLLAQNGWDVTICAAAPWKPLFPEARWIASEAAWGGHRSAEKYRLRHYLSPEFRRFVKKLRQFAAGATGIDTRGDIRSVLLLYLAGCREVLTLSNYLGSDLTMPEAVGEVVEFQAESPRWVSNVRFAERLLGRAAPISGPAFPHLRRVPVPIGTKACLMPVAPWPGKLWVPDRWQELAAALINRGVEPFGLCGPGQMELAAHQLGPGVPVTECVSVEDWARQLQTARFLVTLDSGPMHLANALDVPAIALFGQGLLPLWAPPHPESAVVSHQDDADFHVCAPVGANTKYGQEFMRRISVSEVLDVVDPLLEKITRSNRA